MSAKERDMFSFSARLSNGVLCIPAAMRGREPYTDAASMRTDAVSASGTAAYATKAGSRVMMTAAHGFRTLPKTMFLMHISLYRSIPAEGSRTDADGKFRFERSVCRVAVHFPVLGIVYGIPDIDVTVGRTDRQRVECLSGRIWDQRL